MKKFFPVALFILSISRLAMATVPLSFTHHGILKEDGALVNGTHTIHATIYGDNNTIAGEAEQSVSVESGAYVLTIPNIDVDVVRNADKLELGISVDGTELEPKLAIHSVPYALAAEISAISTSVACEGCITKRHLDFPAMQDSALPKCEDGRTLRFNYTNDEWECSLLHIDEQENGRIGINNSGIYAEGAFKYNKKDTLNPENESELNGINSCECDQDRLAADCTAPAFTTLNDQGPKCYDQYGGSYYIFERDTILAPQPEVAVLDGGKLGLGTGIPKAPLHIRSTGGEEDFEAIIADTVPGVLFEDLDGTNISVSVNNGTLKVSGNIEATNFTISSVNASGTINAKGIGPDLLNVLYPVGAIYISTSATNPATTLGGTWEQIKDRFLLAAGSTYSAGQTGGEATHTLSKDEMPSHNHGATFSGTAGTTSSDGNHTHPLVLRASSQDENGGTINVTTGTNYNTPQTMDSGNYAASAGAHTHTFTPSGSVTVEAAGSGQPHNNMPPYLVVYVWKRTK